MAGGGHCGELTPFRFGSRARLKKGFVHLPKQLITKALIAYSALPTVNSGVLGTTC